MKKLKLKDILESLANDGWRDGEEDNQIEPATDNTSKFQMDEPDSEGEMARSQMIKTMKYAAEIMAMVDESTELPAWVQSKLTKVAEYIGAVKHYMESKTVRRIVTHVTEGKVEEASDARTIRDSEVEEIMINGMNYMLSDLKKSKKGKPLVMGDGSEKIVKDIVGNYDDKNGVYFRFKLDDGTWYKI